MAETVICGGSGLVGAGIARALEQKGMAYSVVGRSVDRLQTLFPCASRWLSWSEFESDTETELAAVINLAGASVMARRWSRAYKQVMTDSRLSTTTICAKVCATRPRTRLLSASSVHAYGIYSGDHEGFTEEDRDHRSGTCYLQELIDAWEDAARPASDAGCSVSWLRIGVVLSEKSGALPSMLPPFRAFVGGRHGSGRQILPWVSLDDLVAMFVFLLEHQALSGPINAVAPNPCTNAEFARAIGQALGRPAAIPAPSIIVRAMMGQAGHELVLSGQRVLPRRLEDAGFEFRDRDIASCVHRLLKRKADSVDPPADATE